MKKCLVFQNVKLGEKGKCNLFGGECQGGDTSHLEAHVTNKIQQELTPATSYT